MLNSSRYRRILFFFARIIVSIFLVDVILPRLGLRGWSRRTRAERWKQAATQFRSLAVAMGGVLIKVGQFLSTRLDVLPEVVTAELANLQDEVSPEPFEAIRQVAEADLQGRLEDRYVHFDSQPLAAASLGQAHRASLAEEGAVVVKVQRPRIEAIVATDLAALRVVGSWLQRYPPIGRRVDMPALLAEFSQTLTEELDYLAEGRNAEAFAHNFRNDPGVRIPQVIWTHTTRHVLTLEDVQAIKITDYEALVAAGIDRAAVAQRLFDTYLKQVFHDGFFHADPHPGNLFVDPVRSDTVDASRPAPTWQLTYIDFGMVGRITPNVRAGLREAIIGIGTRDSARVVKAYQILGILLPQADIAQIEKAEAKLFDRFWGKSMDELRKIDVTELQVFAAEFRDLLFNLPFQVPEDLLLLARTAGILSGICTGLDPDFNVWTSLGPFAQELIAEETTRGWSFWLNEAGQWAATVLTLPKRTENLLGRLERGELEVRDPQTTAALTRLEAALGRLGASILFGACLLGGFQALTTGYTGLGWGLMAAAGLALLRALWP